MATSATVPGFVPVDSPTYTTPVQVTGHVVHNLTVARTPNGQAVFGWTDSATSIFYCAVNPDFEDVYRDDVVADGAERPVFDRTDIGESVQVGSLWVDRGQLFCAVKTIYPTDNAFYAIGYSRCMVADDVENPVVWTQRAVIDSVRANGAGLLIDGCDSAGPAVVLPSGRWVLPFPMWGVYAGDGGADLSGIAYSDDMGIDWVIPWAHREAPGLGGTTGPASDTIGQDPLTGYLYWSHYWGSGANEGYVLESQDDAETWVPIESDSSSVWNFCIDNDDATLYATRAIIFTEWEFYNTVDPAGGWANYVDLNLTAIPSNQTNANFQAIAFLAHGSIAFIDENRIAGQLFPPQDNCPIPDPLFIPYKDRLLKLELDKADRAIPKSFRLMAEHDQDNLNAIERWAANWMTDAIGISEANDSCRLFIPHKDHLHIARDGQLSPAIAQSIAAMSFDNYKTIERWALRITGGECACEGPDKCLLHIPYKNAITQIEVNDDGTFIDISTLQSTAQQDFDNYKTIERWANMNARSECAAGGGFPPGGFPDPPIASARVAAQMIETALRDTSNALITGQMMEVAVTV